MTRALRLSAGWVIPIARPPIRSGAVLLDSFGRIAAVGPDTEVPRPPGVPSHRYPEAAILPGFINVHTHLELTGFAPVDSARPEPFHTWIQGIRTRKTERAPADYPAAAAAGLQNAWATGVTTVADTGDTGAALAALAAGEGSGIYYHEVFGPDPRTSAESITSLMRQIAALAGHTTSRVRLGVSPHAPYTVSGPLYQETAAFARAQQCPLALHLAESEAETELVVRSAGAFAEAWRTRSIPLPDDPRHRADAAARRSPVAWVDAHGVLGPDTLVIHAITVDDEDIDLLAARRAAVAHCPRSNLVHHGRTAPLRRLLDAGVRVGLGTDSAASVAPVDLRREAVVAAALAGLTAEDAVVLLTRGGAAALGLPDVGTLSPGGWGDLTAITVGTVGPEQLWDALLDSDQAPVAGVWLGGRSVGSPKPGA